MPDPLSKTAQEFAPVGGANMFDPTVGRDVIARYGVAGMVRDDMEKNLRLSGFARQERLGAMQEQETVAAAPLRQRQRDLEASKLDFEEEDVRSRRELMTVEGDVARELWSIDPDSPTYEKDYRERLQLLPEGAFESPMIKPALEYHELKIKDKTMQSRWMAQEAERQSRYAMGAGFAAVRAAGIRGVDADVEAAVRSKHTDPSTGEVDMSGYMADLLSTGRGLEIEDREAEATRQQENWMDRLRASKGATERTSLEKEANERADAQLKTNPRAYPSPMDQLRIAAAGDLLGEDATGTREDLGVLFKRSNAKDPGNLEALDAMLDPLAVEDAKRLEKDLPFLARKTAREYKDDMEKYVGLVPGLSEKDKEARRDIWRVANKAWEAPAEKPAAKEDRVLRYNPETGLLE